MAMELIFDTETLVHKWTLECGQWSRSGHRGQTLVERLQVATLGGDTPAPHSEIMNVISAAVSVPVQLSIVIFVMASFIAFLLFP